MNRIFHLERIGSPTYDEACGFVVVAMNEHQARKTASYEKGDEGAEVWLDQDQTTCVEIDTTNVRVVLRDYWSA